MKRKIFSMLLAAVAICFAACSSDDSLTADGGGALRTVQVKVNIPDDGTRQSRATNAYGDAEVTRCMMQVFDSKGNAYTGYTTAKAMSGSESSGFTANVTLDPGEKYTFCFWADGGSSYYTATNLKNVSYAASPQGIAYHGTATCENATSLTATLEHAVAKVTLRTTNNLTARTIGITVPKAYKNFNVLENAGIDTVANGLTVSKSIAAVTAATSGTDVASFYVLCPTETQTVTLFSAGGKRYITNVPLAPNKHIILKGSMSGTTAVAAYIQPEWMSDGIVGEEDGHEYVDLGLSVKWATCNVGATLPTDYGDYFDWGAKKADEQGCWYYSDKFEYKGNTSNIEGNKSYDAAAFQWGDSWRMPKKSEMEELINKCTWTWTTFNGVEGFRVTGKNGNSIFLPAMGYKDGSISYNNSYAIYWTGTYYSYGLNSTKSGGGYKSYARGYCSWAYKGNNTPYTSDLVAYDKCPIRPVLAE